MVHYIGNGPETALEDPQKTSNALGYLCESTYFQNSQNYCVLINCFEIRQSISLHFIQNVIRTSCYSCTMETLNI